MKSSYKLRITQWMTGLVAMVILVTVACGGAAAPAGLSALLTRTPPFADGGGG